MHREKWMQIGLALLCAGVMLVTAYSLADSEYSKTVEFLVIAVWWVPFSYLAGRQQRLACGQSKQCSIHSED